MHILRMVVGQHAGRAGRQHHGRADPLGKLAEGGVAPRVPPPALMTMLVHVGDQRDGRVAEPRSPGGAIGGSSSRAGSAARLTLTPAPAGC